MKKKLCQPLCAASLLLLASVLILTGCAPAFPTTATTPATEESQGSAEPITSVPTTTEEILPYPDDTYAARFFVKTSNKGDTKKLVGKILLNFFLFSDSENVWTEADIKVLKGYHNLALKRMKSDAGRYGVTLDVSFNYIPCSINTPHNRDNATSEVKQALKEIGFSSPNSIVARLKNEFKVNEVALLFCYNGANRSFALPTANSSGFEYAMLYGRDEDFRHELYHLFGARDFYLPCVVNTLAEHYFYNSIMISTDGWADEFTAFLLGWKKTVTQKGLDFLEGCRDLSAKDWANDYDEGYFTGEKTLTLHYGTYTGEFKDGLIHGQGKMVYQNGDVYEGTWKESVRHGQGTLTKANGEVLSGLWEYNLFRG